MDFTLSVVPCSARGGATSIHPPAEEEKPRNKSREKKHKNKKQHKHKKEKKVGKEETQWLLLLFGSSSLTSCSFVPQKKKHKKHKQKGKEQKKRSKKEASDSSSEDSDEDAEGDAVSTEELLRRSEVTSVSVSCVRE